MRFANFCSLQTDLAAESDDPIGRGNENLRCCLAGRAAECPETDLLIAFAPVRWGEIGHTICQLTGDANQGPTEHSGWRSIQEVSTEV